ncbi:MAG: hypothetical protein GXP42_15550 [Chloroflexi bacterium]|nr:hypothetical protein [Chloroflexota bacterium]
MRIKSSFVRHFPFLLLDIGVLLFIGYAVFFRVWFPYPGVEIEPRTGVVRGVANDGFFAELGWLSGDQALAVGETPWVKAASLYHGVRVGETNSWTLRRDGEVLVVSALAPKPLWQESARNLAPLLVAFFYWAVATILWLFSPGHKIIRLFFLLDQLVALVLASGSLAVYTVRWVDPLYYLGYIFVAPVTLHFFSLYPLRRDARYVKRLVQIAYIAAVVLSIQYVLGWALGQRPYLLSDALWSRLRAFFFVATMLLAFGLFVWRWFDAPPRVRQRRRVIAAGVAVSILPMLMFYFLPLLLGASPLVSPEWLFLSLIFLPLAVAYALHSGELGAVDWFLNRTLAHVLLFCLVAALYAGLFWFLNAVLPQSPNLVLPIATISAVLLAVFFTPLHRFLQRQVDRLFYGGWYDYHSVVEQTGNRLRQAKHPQELAEVLLENITKSMHLHCAYLLLPTPASSDEAQLFALAPSDCKLARFSGASFSLSSPLFQALSHFDAPVDNLTLRGWTPITALNERERALLRHAHARLWLPVHFSDEVASGTRLAALILGPKLDGEPFTDEDKNILKTVARQTALIIENLQLLSRLQQRERELEHLYKDLTYTREEERKRIARDLHDNIIQNMHIVYRHIKNHRQLPPEVVDLRLQESAQWLKQTMNDVRRICEDLRPAALDVLGLADAIRAHAEQFARHTGIAVDVVISGNEQAPLSSETEDMLFRILQEALWNVEKHARARQVCIRMSFPSRDAPSPDGLIHLSIQDDGQGFQSIPTLEELLARKTYGILNMYERASIIGGRLRLSSQPGRGVHIEITAPLNPPLV